MLQHDGAPPSIAPVDAHDIGGSAIPGPRGQGTARRWRLPVAALVAGLVVGSAAGAVAGLALDDPRESDDYRALQAQVQSLEAQVEDQEGRLSRTGSRLSEALQSASDAENELATRTAELDEREAAVAAREAAITVAETAVAATSIDEGIWTVGVDVEPGTYRTAEPLSGYCYWAIYRSGTSGGDIVQNDGPEGGFPTVTLSEGQDFENDGCGTFVKQ